MYAKGRRNQETERVHRDTRATRIPAAFSRVFDVLLLAALTLGGIVIAMLAALHPRSGQLTHPAPKSSKPNKVALWNPYPGGLATAKLKATTPRIAYRGRAHAPKTYENTPPAIPSGVRTQEKAMYVTPAPSRQAARIAAPRPIPAT